MGGLPAGAGGVGCLVPKFRHRIWLRTTPAKRCCQRSGRALVLGMSKYHQHFFVVPAFTSSRIVNIVMLPKGDTWEGMVNIILKRMNYGNVNILRHMSVSFSP